MRKQTPLIAFAACIATLSSIGIPTAQAKQKCSAAMPSNPHGYWSWRLIDGRKCWYEGKPMLSKSLLEWPAQASDRDNERKAPFALYGMPITYAITASGRVVGYMPGAADWTSGSASELIEYLRHS